MFREGRFLIIACQKLCKKITKPQFMAKKSFSMLGNRAHKPYFKQTGTSPMTNQIQLKH